MGRQRLHALDLSQAELKFMADAADRQIGSVLHCVFSWVLVHAGLPTALPSISAVARARMAAMRRCSLAGASVRISSACLSARRAWINSGSQALLSPLASAFSSGASPANADANGDSN